MKKNYLFFCLLCCFLLSGCVAKRDKFNLAKYGPVIEFSEDNLPYYILPDEFVFEGKTYSKKDTIKKLGSDKENDRIITTYITKDRNSEVVIMDEFGQNEQEAEILFNKQTAMRDARDQSLLKLDDTFYAIGADQQFSLGYLIVSRYNRSLYMTRLCVFINTLTLTNNQLFFNMTPANQQAIVDMGQTLLSM